MNNVQPKRHIAKTISYRFLSSGIGFVIVWLSTDSFVIGASFSFVEIVFKPFLYFIHERIWYKYIKYGLKK
jgi:uncharacterized membrane protein